MLRRVKQIYSGYLHFVAWFRNWILPLAILAFVLIFTQKTTQILNAVLVAPLLSTLDHSNVGIDMFCIVISILMVSYFVVKAVMQVRISITLVAYVSVLFVIYLFYRSQKGNPFLFVAFNNKSLPLLYLADILFMPLIGVVLYYTIYYYLYFKKSSISGTTTRPFFIDSPLVLKATNDLFARHEYVLDVKARILATDTPEHSFAIGIVGKWGAGKTTFIKTLEAEFENENNIVQINFNPWVTKSSEGMTNIFFSDLASKLAFFDESLKSEILSYSKEIIQSIDNSSLALIRTLFMLSAQDKSLKEKYEGINRSIRKLKKKIIVFIDDVDRLDKHEIIEVLRIIRNTANFSNTFFIVAFDKVYVTTSINNALTSDTEKYLEKIFQLEYYLPIYPEKNIYENALIGELKKVVIEEDIPVLDRILLKNYSAFQQEVVPPIKKYIQSIRDVNRFMNVFLVNYDRIKYNIYLPDYITMSILRLKYPEVYLFLYAQTYYYMRPAGDPDIFDSEGGVISIQFDKKGASDITESNLYKFLEKNPKGFALNPNEIEDVVCIVASVFPSSSGMGSYKNNRTLRNNHMSISNVSCYERYFDCSMEGRLDQHEFNQAFEKPDEELYALMQAWCKEQAVSSDLQIKLENFVEFPTREMYEKVVRAIIYYTSLPAIRNADYNNSFSTENLFYKLGAKEYKRNIVDNLYAGDTEPFKRFVSALFKSASAKQWNFFIEFSRMLINDYEHKFILTHDELRMLLTEALGRIMDQAGHLTGDIMRCFNVLVRLHKDPSASLGDSTPYAEGLPIADKIREFVFKDLAFFLGFDIYKEGRTEGYAIGNWDKLIYETDEDFMKALQPQKDEPAVEEFLRFWELYTKGNKIPIDNFEFKHLKTS